jgi:hypothetical protein
MTAAWNPAERGTRWEVAQFDEGKGEYCMTDHPSTFKAKRTHREGVEWNDRAAVHRVGDGDGLFDGAKALRRGTFAEMIEHMMLLPAEERARYLVEKAGDREYSAAEVEELAARSDYPGKR